MKGKILTLEENFDPVISWDILEKYEPKTDSFIFQFMCFLDCKIQKLNDRGKIDLNDVEEILNFNWWSLNSKCNTGKSELKISGFYSWFCVMDNCLDELMDLFKDNGGNCEYF